MKISIIRFAKYVRSSQLLWIYWYSLSRNKRLYSDMSIKTTFSQNVSHLCECQNDSHGPLARYVKLWFAHEPGMPGTFSPPPTSKETAGYRSRHVSRHVRDARAVMHVGIENVPDIPGAYATQEFTYLIKGSCSNSPLIHSGNYWCYFYNHHHFQITPST